MSFMNRPQVDGNFGGPRMFRTVKDFRGRTPRNGNFNSAKQRPLPPEATGAEAFYYLKQMSSRTPMVVVTTDGEVIRGVIEWYDRNCLKVNREGAPNVLIQKHCIKYLFKQEDE